jgi:hypothetical protein
VASQRRSASALPSAGDSRTVSISRPTPAPAVAPTRHGLLAMLRIEGICGSTIRSADSTAPDRRRKKIPRARTAHTSGRSIRRSNATSSECHGETLECRVARENARAHASRRMRLDWPFEPNPCFQGLLNRARAAQKVLPLAATTRVQRQRCSRTQRSRSGAERDPHVKLCVRPTTSGLRLEHCRCARPHSIESLIESTASTARTLHLVFQAALARLE